MQFDSPRSSTPELEGPSESEVQLLKKRLMLLLKPSSPAFSIVSTFEFWQRLGRLNYSLVKRNLKGYDLLENVTLARQVQDMEARVDRLVVKQDILRSDHEDLMITKNCMMSW